MLQLPANAAHKRHLPTDIDNAILANKDSVSDACLLRPIGEPLSTDSLLRKHVSHGVLFFGDCQKRGRSRLRNLFMNHGES